MARLSKIYINKPPGMLKLELRLEWDNDRHESVAVGNLEPDDVKDALLQAWQLIERDQQRGHL